MNIIPSEVGHALVWCPPDLWSTFLFLLHLWPEGGILSYPLWLWMLFHLHHQFQQLLPLSGCILVSPLWSSYLLTKGIFILIKELKKNNVKAYIYRVVGQKASIIIQNYNLEQKIKIKENLFPLNRIVNISSPNQRYCQPFITFVHLLKGPSIIPDISNLPVYSHGPRTGKSRIDKEKVEFKKNINFKVFEIIGYGF